MPGKRTILITEETNKQLPPLDSLPFRNKNAKDLPGEIWKEIPIPELEGNILLSDFGRVKSLARDVPKSNGFFTRKPENILSPYVEKVAMKHNKNIWFVVGISIGYNKKFHNLMISRWMYYLFVEPFDMEDKTIVITFKDSNNINLRPYNLLLSSRGAEIVRSFSNGSRPRNAFNTIPRKVEQLNEQHEVINSFPSVNQAAQFFKHDSKTIWGMLKGKFKNKFNVRYAAE